MTTVMAWHFGTTQDSRIWRAQMVKSNKVLNSMIIVILLSYCWSWEWKWHNDDKDALAQQVKPEYALFRTVLALSCVLSVYNVAGSH